MKTQHHFNELTEAELERLAILNEECAEVQHMVSKIIRHGYESSDPTVSVPVTNRKLLADELGDLLYSITLIRDKDIGHQAVAEAYKKRSGSLSKYLHHTDLV